jgi:hypothetical protein
MAAAAAAGPLGSSPGQGGWNDAELEAAVEELVMEEAPPHLARPHHHRHHPSHIISRAGR